MARPPKISNEDILAAARQVFLEQGMGASTLDIAERAGISEASIFKRFSTKQALFVAAMGILEKPQWVKVLANYEPTANIKSELTDICEQMLAFYQDVMPRMLMLMTQGKLPDPPSIVPPPIRDRKLLVGFLDRAVQAGHLRICDTQTVAQIIIGTIINTVVTQHMIHKLSIQPAMQNFVLPPSETLIQNLIETLWVGIAPDS
ncbi:TetR/AcrR family transcriptional regulator [Acaryochloris sp. IP29b_bin.137]|uniref:TetR/AcrR family transcriptional regulator n=1 Tax=Acaryochloris sp. IP29b_bin.137 TaxID=2969217 RepID=UPI002631CA0A|nr:TetR/AcrR family transcriptional regulator [Acaryochloris sp. IP29b_bin.137]